jgi:hypothetical protein
MAQYADPQGRVTFSYPTAWKPQMGSLPAVIVLLSQQPISDPCAVATPPPDCTQHALTKLQQDQLVAEWSTGNVPKSTYENAPNDGYQTASGQLFRAEQETAVDDTCHAELGNAEELIYIAVNAQPVAILEQVYVVQACIRAPDPSQITGELIAMVTSSMIPK